MEMKFVVRPTKELDVAPLSEVIDLSSSSITEGPNRDEERRAELERLRNPRNPGEALFGALFAMGSMIDGIAVAAGGEERKYDTTNK